MSDVIGILTVFGSVIMFSTLIHILFCILIMLPRFIYTFQLYLCWNNPEVYSQITYPRVGSTLTWPLTAVLPCMKKTEVLKHLRHVGWKGKCLEEVSLIIYSCHLLWGQIIILTNADLLSITILRTYFTEISITMPWFSFKNVHFILKFLSPKSWLFCSGFIVLNHYIVVVKTPMWVNTG